MNEKDFKKLQKEWNQKLKDSGFRDIEDDKGNLRVPTGIGTDLSNINNEEVDVVFEIKREYFQLLEHFIDQTQFKNEIEKEIIVLRSQGISILEIAKKTNLNRNTITKKIAKYEKQWLIKKEN